MSEKFSFDESIFLGHFLKLLVIQIEKGRPDSRGITKETSPDSIPVIAFSLEEFKKDCIHWRKDKLLKILRGLKDKNYINFTNYKTQFHLMFLDHGSLLKEFGYV